MKDILITSSALIAALLLLRLLFRKVLSRRVQYALWGLVLLRLLIPGSLPAVDFSVLTAAQPVEQAVAARIEAQGPIYLQPMDRRPVAELPPGLAEQAAPGVELQTEESFGYTVVDPGGETATRYAAKMGAAQVLSLIWKGGMVLVGTFFLLSNLALYRRLRRVRAPYEGPRYGTRRPIYLIPQEALPSPCLFGLLRPAIYLTPAALQREESLRHVLLHEETHARHLDHLWSLLRCLCLTIYWFDPLVWAAAACSKVDCELACDESVLKALGEDQRVDYGRTLLSLIPVRRPSNPLLAATTMTAGKSQLKDRITRIAQNPRQLLAAAVAVSLLAGIVSACAFTGGREETPDPDESALPMGWVSPLTGEELRWFHEEFFNTGGADHSREPYVYFGIGQTQYYNLRNQFASPLNLYNSPEDIDLFQLFYCEDSEPFSDEELQAALGYDTWEDLPCPAYKLTAERMDALLQAHTGLTLEETDQVGLDQFSYLEDYDAYYWAHGDTNYPGELTFPYGTREETEEGTLIQLYQGSGEDWYRLTLLRQGETYLFRANTTCVRPSIPPARPSMEPDTAISLADLEPYRVSTPATEPWDGFEEAHQCDVYQAADGTLVSVYGEEDGTYSVVAGGRTGVTRRFLSLTSRPKLAFFQLFGQSGISVTYSPGPNIGFYPTDTDYYTFDDSGLPALLARCHGESHILDLDGSGGDELVAPRQLFFQRDGQIYEARLDDLLHEACPDLQVWEEESWDLYGRHLAVTGCSQLMSGNPRTWSRLLGFDGRDLLVYRAAIGPALPEGEPLLTIPLDSLEPYTPQPVDLTAGAAPARDAILGECQQGTTRIQVWSTNVSAILVTLLREGEAPQDFFFTTTPNSAFLGIEPFQDLLGQDGFCLDHLDTPNPTLDHYHYTADLPVRDYYYLDEEGTPALLARCYPDWDGSVQIIDLDGDGGEELVTPTQIFTLREGRLYELRLDQLLLEADPTLEDYSALLPTDRLFYPTGYTAAPDYLLWRRVLAYTGDALLVYPNDLGTRDHFSAQARQTAPGEVLSAAQEFTLSRLDPRKDPWFPTEGEESEYLRYNIDDWRIESTRHIGSYTLAGVTVEAWSVNYELHTPTPKEVTMAGGRYVTDDGWVSPGYPGSDTLFFRLQEDGSRQLLYYAMINDASSDSVAFREGILDHLRELGVAPVSGTYEAEELALYLQGLLYAPARLTLAGTEGSHLTLENTQRGVAYSHALTLPTNYRWARVEAPAATPQGPSVLLSDLYWYDMLQIYQEDDLVMYKLTNSEPVWYQGEVLEDAPTPYELFREWYEEEKTALSGE